MSSTPVRLAAALLTSAAVLVTAAPASAGTIRYSVSPSPSYTIQDNGNGIVKVAYNGCVTAGERQTLSFQMATSVSGDGNAVFKVLKVEGGDPVTTFDPASVLLQKGVEQTFSVTLAFSIPSANNGVTTFRIKLDPESGEGLGEGAGIMVRLPCVLAAPPAPQPAAEQPAGQSPAPAGSTEGSSGAPTPLTAPTAGRFPAVTAPQAAAAASCVSTPRRFRLRAGETTTVRVAVRTNGQSIQGARVRATYPGATQVKTTDARGVATFRIRPRRPGRLVLQSDVCFGADRVRVLGARVVGRRAPARFTG